MESGSARKYLLYAIGEILLVMLGILLALQINNWNEGRKKSQQEANILMEMKGNLQGDLRDIQYNIEEDSETLTSINVILDILEQRLPFHDSLSRHYASVGRNSTFIENTSAFQNLESLGFDLISNDSLRQRITHLYSVHYQYINEINAEVIRRHIWDNLSPQLLKYVKSKIVLVEAYPLDHSLLFDNNAFQEALRWHRELKKFILNLNENVSIEIVKTIEVIDQELSP